MTIVLLVNLAGYAAFWLLAPVLAGLLHVPDGSRLFRLAAVDLPFFGLFTALRTSSTAAASFWPGRRHRAYGLTKVVGTLVLFASGTVSVEGALIVNIAASVIGLGFLLPWGGGRILRPSLAEQLPILRLALPVALGDVGVQTLLGLDLWSLNALGAAIPAEVKGQYVAALNLARVPNLLAFVLASVLIPSISRALADNDRATARGLVLVPRASWPFWCFRLRADRKQRRRCAGAAVLADLRPGWPLPRAADLRARVGLHLPQCPAGDLSAPARPRWAPAASTAA